MQSFMNYIASSLGIIVEIAYLLIGLVVGILLMCVAKGRSATKEQSGPSFKATEVLRSTPTRPSASMNETIRDLDPAVMHEVETLFRQGNFIGAIKKVREATGLGLKEAKDLAETFRQRRS